jgi:hypothetical protein
MSIYGLGGRCHFAPSVDFRAQTGRNQPCSLPADANLLSSSMPSAI